MHLYYDTTLGAEISTNAPLPAHKLHAGLKPIVIVEPTLGANQVKGAASYTVNADDVTKTWAVVDVPVAVPPEVDSVAIKTVLFNTPTQGGASNMLDDAEALVATQARPVQLYWNRHTFRRDDVTLNTLAKAAPPNGFGLSDAQMDTIFVAAQAASAAGVSA